MKLSVTRWQVSSITSKFKLRHLPESSRNLPTFEKPWLPSLLLHNSRQVPSLLKHSSIYPLVESHLLRTFVNLLDSSLVRLSIRVSSQILRFFPQHESSQILLCSSAAEAYARGSQQVFKAAGYEPSPTDLSQSAASLARAAQSSASSAYSNVVSDVPSSVSSALAQASSIIDKQGENVVSSASSLVVSGASVVSSLAAPHSTFIGAAPVLDRLGNVKEQVNEFFGDVSQGAIRAVGGEPSPTDVRQAATSLASVVSSKISEAGSAVSSLAQPHSDFTKSASIPTVLPGGGGGGGGGIKASLESLASSASSALHDVTRTTPEGIQETASSLASVAKESLSSLSSAAGSLAAPHSSYTKSTAAASIQSGLDQATGFVAKATAQAKSIAHDAKEEVKSAIHVEL